MCVNCVSGVYVCIYVCRSREETQVQFRSFSTDRAALLTGKESSTHSFVGTEMAEEERD